MKIKNRAQTNPLNNNRGNNQTSSTTFNSNSQRPYIVVPYAKALSESFKNVCSKRRIQVYFREVEPSKTSWWPKKTKNLSPKIVGSYTDMNVTGWNLMRSISESSGTLGERFKGHLKATFPIYYHYSTTGHTTTV